MYKVKTSNGNVFEIEKTNDELIINGEKISLDIATSGTNFFHVLHNNQSYNIEVIEFLPNEKKVSLIINNKRLDLQFEDRYDQLLKQLGFENTSQLKANHIKAPMPGLVLKVLLKEGDVINAGDNAVVLEAMKMENVLKATGNGKVKAIKVKAGDKVEKNQVMIEME